VAFKAAQQAQDALKAKAASAAKGPEPSMRAAALALLAPDHLFAGGPAGPSFLFFVTELPDDFPSPVFLSAARIHLGSAVPSVG